MSTQEPEKYEKKLYFAMLAQQCSRYEETINYLQELFLERKKDFNKDERNLLSYAYIKFISQKRHALRVTMAYETKEKKYDNSPYLSYIQEYRKELETDLTQQLQKIILNLDSLLIKKAENVEAKIFYKKLKGDYNRYIAEYSKDDLKEKVMKDALTAYQEAINLCKDQPVLNILILGLALNYSIFYYEVMNERKTALKIATEYNQKITKELENFDEDKEENQDIMNLVHLIRENIDMWKSEETEQTE